MANEELWQSIQKAMGYTDEQVALAQSNPYQRKVLEAGPQLVRRKIVAEVVEARNCVAHPVGTRYVIRANGVVRTEECSNRLCLSMLGLLIPVFDSVFHMLAEGHDPVGMTRYIRCPDTGVECGGFGKAMVKVTVE